MVTCKCCPYGFHIYLDFVQYCEKLGKTTLTHEQRVRRNNRRQRKSKILMLGFDEFDQILNVPYGYSTESLNTSYFTCYPHEKNEFIKNIVKDMGQHFDQILDSKISSKQRYDSNNPTTKILNPSIKITNKPYTVIQQPYNHHHQHQSTNSTSNRKDYFIIQKNATNKQIINSSGKKYCPFYKPYENMDKKLAPIDVNFKDNFIVNKFEKKQLKEIDAQHLFNKIANFSSIKCDENMIEQLVNKDFVTLKKQLKSPINQQQNNVAKIISTAPRAIISTVGTITNTTQNKNSASDKFVEMENVKNLIKPSVKKDMKNMATMTTTAIFRDIAINTIEIDRRSVETQIETDNNFTPTLISIGTQTSIAKTAKTMGTQTMHLEKTFINRTTSTANNEQFMCTKCSKNSSLHHSNISLKSLNAFNNNDQRTIVVAPQSLPAKEEPVKIKKILKTIATQSSVDMCNKSIQHSSKTISKSTCTNEIFIEQKTPAKKLDILHKSIGTNSIYTKEIGTITNRPIATKTIDRGTFPIRVEQKTVACGDAIKPHILISCADNYCDSCKDIVKNLARTFINAQDCSTDTHDLPINFNSETILPSISLPGEQEITLKPIDVYYHDIIEKPIFDHPIDEDVTIDIETHVRILPTETMVYALDAINIILERSESSNIKINAEIVGKTEWFQISSAESSNPLDVKDFLDYAKTKSNHLVEFLVNLKDTNGNTAMHYAISHGNYGVAEIILDTGAYDINQMNGAGYTCAMLVALTNLSNAIHLTIARRLFALADVNIRARNHGQTALMIAVSHGNLNMVQMLLEANADVNIQDEDGSTALMCAAEHGRIDIVKLLLAQPNCDSTIQDIDNSTALKISVEAGYRDIGILLYAHERVYGKKNGKRL